MTGITTLIPATQAAANGTPFTVLENQPVTLVAFGFDAANDDNHLDLQITYDGTNYVDCYKDSTKIQLKSVNNPVTVYGPGRFRIAKEITTGEVGVSMWQIR